MPLDPSLQEFSTSSPSIASYDYTDLASGTGIQTFYIANGEISTGDQLFLTEQTLISNDKLRTYFVSIGGSIGGVWTKVIDEDYDLTLFNVPKQIKGKLTVQIPFGGHRVEGGTLRIIVKLAKYSGTTETIIATLQSQDVAMANGYNNLPGLMTGAITETHFSTGDILRVIVELWGHSLGNTNEWIYFGCDPSNTQYDANITQTQAKILVPFKLDI